MSCSLHGSADMSCSCAVMSLLTLFFFMSTCLLKGGLVSQPFQTAVSVSRLWFLLFPKFLDPTVLVGLFSKGGDAGWGLPLIARWAPAHHSVIFASGWPNLPLLICAKNVLFSFFCFWLLAIDLVDFACVFFNQTSFCLQPGTCCFGTLHD